MEGHALDDWNAAAIRSCEDDWREPARCNAAPVHEPEDDGDEHGADCAYCKRYEPCRRVTIHATEEYEEEQAWLCRRCYAEALDAGDFTEL